MDGTPSLNLDLNTPDASAQPVYRRLALVNGLLIGLAVGLGAWGLEALRVARLPAPLYLPTLALGLAAAMLLCALVGWLSGRFARTPVTFLLWILTAVACMYLIGYLPFQGQTLVAWLADPRFMGRAVFPNAREGTHSGLILGGLLLILVLGVLGLLQNYRLEGLVAEVGRKRGWGARVWLALLLPVPIVFVAALVTGSVLVNPAATALDLTNRAIAGGQGYQGDFRDRGVVDDVNYRALRGLEGKIDGDYRLDTVLVDPAAAMVVTGVSFDNGTLVHCQVINDQLSYCYDAANPYLIGVRSLITGEPLPDPCRGCAIEVDETWRRWLGERRERLGDAFEVTLVAQRGTQTIVRASAPGPDAFAVECRLEGLSPIRLTECHDA